jgi:hypothetical protein
MGKRYSKLIMSSIFRRTQEKVKCALRMGCDGTKIEEFVGSPCKKHEEI